MATAPGKSQASSRHLSCQDCRIRVHDRAPEIGLLQGHCPICGAMLEAVPSASGVVGLRRFDLDALAEGPSDRLPARSARPADLAARRRAVTPRHQFDAERSSDDRGGITGAR